MNDGLTECERLAIEEVLDKFDWEAVRAHMDGVDWKWGNDLGNMVRPSFSEMRKTGKELLATVVKGGMDASETGGFRASLWAGVLRLDFVLTWWEVCFPETESR